MALAKAATSFFIFAALAMKATSAQSVGSCTAVHTVVSGEWLSKIADTYGVSVSDILASNSAIKNPDLISPGQAIKIPPCTGPSSEQTSAPSSGSCTAVHTVVSGDWLSTIANKYGVSMDEILAYNPDIKEPGSLYPSQKIKIPPCSVAAPPRPPTPVVSKTFDECYKSHTVVPGDSIYQIAKKYSVDSDDILTYNPEVTNPNLIQIGQQLRIPPCHEVVSGESTPPPSLIDPSCGSTEGGCSWSRVTHFKCNGPACNWLLDYACIKCGPTCTAAAGSAPGTCGSSCILDEVPEPQCCRLLALCREYEDKGEATCMVGDAWLSLNVSPKRDPAKSFQVHCDGPRTVSAGFRGRG